jgi:hypothetical protein
MPAPNVKTCTALKSLRRRESSLFKHFWTPAFAGVTVEGTFYEIINVTNRKRMKARDVPWEYAL